MTLSRSIGSARTGECQGAVEGDRRSRWTVAEDDLVSAPLDDEERRVLSSGIAEWGGPARCTEEFAQAMGFDSLADLHAERPRLLQALGANQPMSRKDWRRALLLTEVVFVSDVVGSGVDWETTTRPSDEETIRLLRGIQRKMVRVK
jgi:hypothetical protein